MQSWDVVVVLSQEEVSRGSCTELVFVCEGLRLELPPGPHCKLVAFLEISLNRSGLFENQETIPVETWNQKAMSLTELLKTADALASVSEQRTKPISPGELETQQLFPNFHFIEGPHT